MTSTPPRQKPYFIGIRPIICTHSIIRFPVAYPNKQKTNKHQTQISQTPRVLCCRGRITRCVKLQNYPQQMLPQRQTLAERKRPKCPVPVSQIVGYLVHFTLHVVAGGHIVGLLISLRESVPSFGRVCAQFSNRQEFKSSTFQTLSNWFWADFRTRELVFVCLSCS